jgi:hypothetical protein
LLSWAWVAHTIEVDNAFERASAPRAGRHFRISLPMWTNGLRFIGADGITVDELRASAGAACNIGGLERWGWISVGAGDRRRDGYGTHRGVKGDTILRPTRAGEYAGGLWPRVVSDVEGRWRDRFGSDVADRLGKTLVSRASPMPWSPPEVHPSDGFFTHIVNSDFIGRPPPLVASLGIVLTALTLEHERDSEVSLPLGANVLRVVGQDAVRVRDLPALSGISKEGVAMAVGYLERRRLASPSSERAIALTKKGLDALDDYSFRAARRDDPELRGGLEAVLAQTDALAAGLVPPDGGWRGERPYLAQTQRILAGPTGALPWHPMVLHRGGWPDAS